MHEMETMIALNRFGLGARPGEAVVAGSDPRGWLVQQLADPGAGTLHSGGLRTTEQILRDFYEFRDKRRDAKKTGEEVEKAASRGDFTPRGEWYREAEARTRFALTTERSFHERLVRFWSNHFTVSASKGPVAAIAGAFEREAIRPRVTGSFSDLLTAAELHQAMLLYLDNALSVGPGSLAGKRRNRGLNENHAREILELHTVGVDGGYSQDDVIELARALTGWTVSGPRDNAADGKTWFDARRHEPGKRKIMGSSYPAAGADQAGAVLADLARKPRTARLVAIKLARHFIADEPPEGAVQALESAFNESDGDLAQVYAVLIARDEAWQVEQLKFKTPDEFHLSALRGLGARTLQRNGLRATFASLGQAPFNAPSPAGWPDRADSWLGPDAVKKRFEWSGAVASRMRGRTDPREFLAESLGEVAGNRTRLMINGADSREQGLTLALMSPEFQRR
ncbi:MAG: DUF1800 domain-containing protein [Gammaproteobacteria bacterium]|nr:DUF1800 domain-containing protein [Gammaproteobacteria bacterium]NNK32033.1 DUF1800 domain-containing protein [Xanthomonadales bacterium]